MGRTKGSKNKSTIEVESLQKRIYELERSYNTYDEVVSQFVDGFIIDATKSIKTISIDTLQKWFNNPDANMENIINLLTYYYIIDGNIAQLYDLMFSLPKLDYKITTYGEKTKEDEKNITLIRQTLDKQVKYKRLTRDLLVQLAHEGTVLGTWLGGKKPYFYVFSNLDYIYPYGMNQGEMLGVVDLKWLDDMKEIERQALYENLSPLVSESKYLLYKNAKKDSEDKRYVILPRKTSLVARTRTLNRSQRLGLPHGTNALFDIQHKMKMKDLERAIADKIIRSIAVLKFKGKDDNDVKVKDSTKREVFNKVKKALEKNEKDKGLTCIAIPDFADIQYQEIKGAGDVFDDKKYTATNHDITTSTGISSVLTNGTGGNYASANLNLDVVYQKIAVMLEDIEEIYNQLITIILGESKALNYRFEFNKEAPLKKKDKIDILMRLHNMEGFSLKYVIDELGVDFEQYITQSLYEQEELQLPNKILPYSSAFTGSGSQEGVGRPPNDEDVNDSTIQSKEKGKTVRVGDS